jgi:hypothetical protein
VAAPSETPDDKRRTFLRILAPRDGNVVPRTFSVGGSTDADDGDTVTTAVNGGGDQDGTVDGGAWQSNSFTRDPGPYTARARCGPLSSSSVNFTVEDDPGLAIQVSTVTMVITHPNKRNLTLSGTHNSLLGPLVTADLYDRTGAHVKSADDGTSFQAWEQRSEFLDLGLYVVEVTRTINDQRVTASMLVHVT